MNTHKEMPMRNIFNALIKECGYEKGKEIFEWYCKSYGITINDSAPTTISREVFGSKH